MDASDQLVPQSVRTRRIERADVVALVGVLAVALGARTLRLTVSLWLDEAWSLVTAEDLTSFDAQRPLYFLFLRMWMHVAHSEATLRLPSVFFGVAWIAVCFVIAHRVGGRLVATVAGLFAALSTTQAFHAQEVRMYSLAALMISCAALFYLRWVERGRTGWLAAHALFAYAAVLTFTSTALGLVGMWLATMLLGRSRRVTFGTLGAMVTVGAAWLPFALLAVKETDGTSWLQSPAVSLPFYLQSWAFLGFSLYTWMPPTFALWTTRAMAILIAALVVYGAVGTRWKWPALWYFGIVALVFAISVTVRPIWQPRYLTPFMPALFIATAAGVAKLFAHHRGAALGVTGLILALQAGSIVSDDGPIEDWRGAAALVDRARPTDVVLVARETEMNVWNYYYHGTAPTRFVPEEGTPDAWHMRMAAILGDQDLDRTTVWLVRRLSSPLKLPEFAELRERLERSFHVDDYFYENVDVMKISRKNP